VVLSYAERPELRDLSKSHAFVLDGIIHGLRDRLPAVERQGTSDLTIGGRKFSGNSLRAKRSHFLYHGTLLYDFDLALIATCLRTAPRQPAYRRSRSHEDFVANLPLAKHELKDALRAAWPTWGELADWPRARVANLVDERYGLETWNLAYGRS
jgi:lipoate-protein ligase A